MDKTHWSKDAIFYHLYPLGQLGAPLRNTLGLPTEPRLEQLHAWLPHLEALGINALYLGPVFEATAHGYDTVDYFAVDRRLGTNDTLRDLAEALQQRGIRLVLDAVFHHVGRDFWAFRDVLEKGQESAYCSWFYLDFGSQSPAGDPFAYEGWDGHYDLVKLNLSHQDVRAHLFSAVELWLKMFKISGLRLDAADRLSADFMRELATFGKSLDPDFWLVGEVVSGDYRQWANPEMLDSVTNYECYKGLWSSHRDANYFELSHTLNRQFGKGGLYQDLDLYNFADNHDVNRVASNLARQAQLYPLYILLFTMPGIPSLYAGSEWGLMGERTPESDTALRSQLELARLSACSPQPDLARTLGALSNIRKTLSPLRYGTYETLHTSHEQFAFLRRHNDERVVVAVNAASEAAVVEVSVPGAADAVLTDLLNPAERIELRGGRISLVLPPCWSSVLRLARA